MDENYISERLAQLRTQMGVSVRGEKRFLGKKTDLRRGDERPI